MTRIFAVSYVKYAAPRETADTVMIARTPMPFDNIQGIFEKLMVIIDAAMYMRSTKNNVVAGNHISGYYECNDTNPERVINSYLCSTRGFAQCKPSQSNKEAEL